MNAITRNKEIQELLQKTQFKTSKINKVCYLLLGVGLLGVILSFVWQGAALFWQTMLINTLFFCGVSLAGLMFSLIFTVTDAYWGRPMKRFAESLISFFPVAIIFFFLLFFAGGHLFEWVDHDKVIHSKEGWLNYTFFVIRNIVMLLLTAFFACYYLKNTLRPDIGLAQTLNMKFHNILANILSSNYGEHENETKKNYLRNRRVAPILAVLLAFLISLIAFDWMSSIDQEWFSTMFGVQYLVSSLISGGVFLMILSGVLRKKYEITDYYTIYRYNDLVKLTYAFCLLWSYMIFSQVIVIWYANLPEETPFLVLRMKSEEWGWMFWVIFFMVFLIPFLLLMPRTACRSIGFSRIIALIIFSGIWLEKYFIVVPSLQENQADALGGNVFVQGFEPISFIINILVFCGFLGIFLSCVLWFLSRVPILPIADNRLFKPSH